MVFRTDVNVPFGKNESLTERWQNNVINEKKIRKNDIFESGYCFHFSILPDLSKSEDKNRVVLQLMVADSA